MAKCQHCRGCLDVVRVDFEDGAEIVHYCYLCQKMYQFGNTSIEVINDDLLKKVEEIYKKRYNLK